MADIIEDGDVFFFYRNVVGVDRAEGLDDVQHLFVLMVPDRSDHGRMLVVGRKRLPDIDEEPDPSQRAWLMTLASGPPAQLADGLGPLEYETATEGTRRQAEAIPCGAGRYAIHALEDDGGDTYLAYRLAKPSRPGEAQQALGIRGEAGYVVAVRNPDVEVEGFPDGKPDYPAELASRFADMRWIDVDDPRLIDHEKAQLVLIGAFEGLDGGDPDLSGDPDLFEELGLDRDQWPTAALENGRFAQARYELPFGKPIGDRSRGGRRGGRAALQAPSAAGIARALEGIGFPQDRDGLVAHAQDRGVNEAIVETIAELPDRGYRDMADVEKGLSEIR